MKRFPALYSPLVIVAMLLNPVASSASSSPGTQGSPQETPVPSTTITEAVNSRQLIIGAAGHLIEPIPPQTVTPARSDPLPSTSGTSAPPPPPPPGCPPALAYMRPMNFYPTFTRNSAGGYDGHDPDFGYDVPNAIPPGGDPSQTALYSPATAGNIAGHVVAVNLSFAVRAPQGTSTVPKLPVAPAGTFCDDGGIWYGFSQPFLFGDSPPPVPPASVLEAPPFGLGADLLAQVMSHWRIGTIGTLPGPGDTTRTFVHIPTCAWLDSDVPTAPVQLHAIKTAISNGYTLFLIYTVTVIPESVTWDWGDGTQTTSVDAPTTPPPTLPTYDASTQTWTNPCPVSHSYNTVSEQGRTITAREAFTTSVSVTWSDGVAAHSQDVACDTSTAGPCTSTIGPAQGWVSGPHPVDQIEPIPFNPKARS